MLNKETDSMRSFLKTVNPSMYLKLNQLGQQYFIKEFKKPSDKVVFPDIETTKIEHEGQEDIQLQSQYLEEGIKLLKQTVQRKLVKEGYQLKKKLKVKVNKPLPRVRTTEDLITPLVYLMRGNEEIKVKKKEVLSKIKVNNSKESQKNKKMPEIDPLLLPATFTYDVDVNPETKRLEFRNTYSNYFSTPKSIKAKSKYMQVHSLKTCPKAKKSNFYVKKFISFKNNNLNT